MPKHTPGPWQIHEDKILERTLKYFIFYKNPGEQPIVIGEVRNESDAILMAISPELLEAAEKALEDCVDLIGTEAGIALEKAIAKAKGEPHAN